MAKTSGGKQMSMLVRIAMAAALSVGVAGMAAAQGAGVLKPRQLVTQFSCAEARDLEASLGKVASLSADTRRELEIVWTTCAAQQHNQDHPDQLQVVLVAPAASAPATQNKTYVATVRLADGDGVREFCGKAGASVATDAGPVSCESFVGGAKAALIVFAPASVGGGAVTARVLALAGSGDPDHHLAYETERVAKLTRASAAQGMQATLEHPMLQVAANGGVATLSGNGGLLIHTTKCMATMGFGAGCPNR
jgi:hypothetical protein